MRLAVVVLVALASIRPADASCPERPGAKTIPIARGAVNVDGKLDDATWQHACFVADFTQKQPVFGAPPSHPVRVAVAIDDRTLYIGARMWSAGPDDISDALTQRDDTSQAERFIVSIDPSHTRRLAYSFAVTARGVRADWIHTDDSEYERDLSWNPVWIAKAELVADGWVAEMAIPLSQLRLPRSPQTSWGINFNWYVPHRQEDVFWFSVPADRTAWASMFGQLTELPPIDGGLGLELLPYVSSRLVLDEDPAGRGASRWVAGLEAGLDLKLRPLSGVTVAATINPDFGQVEIDPAFVNLTAFEVRLPERRPFFVENAPLFANAGGDYFYSRRIGASGARILGAIAAGGYAAEHTQIAIVGALTDEHDIDGTIVAPPTGWSAARVEHQLGASVVGATATAVGRGLGSSELADVLPRSAFVAGADLMLRDDDRTYELAAAAGVSSVYGSAPALALVQQSSAHYFQRPGQGYLDFDPSATSLTGWHGGVAVAKRAGLWQGSASMTAESPRLELNDIGALESADDITASFDIARNVTTPTARIFSWSTGGGVAAAWNFGGDRRPVDVYANAELVTRRFWSINGNAHYVSPGAVDELTRGGPSMRVRGAGNLSLSASTPSGRARQLSANLTLEASPTLDQGVTGSLTLAARVVPALRIDLEPSVSFVETQRQYVETVAGAGGGDDTYGARYLFGHLARKEVALELRATWSLSPDLVLTLYAQPFLSIGRYHRIGELVRARGADVRWYEMTMRGGERRTIVDGATSFSIEEPDFRVASLRSTAVLRWELAPGSTLFVVWQQARDQASALHTLAIKLSYWFG